MARRTKPCEFCETEQWWSEEGSPGHQIYTEIYPEHNVISFTSFANDTLGESEEMYSQIEMNYCPMCGRKLI